MGVFNSMLANVYGRLSISAAFGDHRPFKYTVNIMFSMQPHFARHKHIFQSLHNLPFEPVPLITQPVMLLMLHAVSLGQSMKIVLKDLVNEYRVYTILYSSARLSLSLSPLTRFARLLLQLASLAQQSSTELSALRAIEHIQGRVLNHGRTCQCCDSHAGGASANFFRNFSKQFGIFWASSLHSSVDCLDTFDVFGYNVDLSMIWRRTSFRVSGVKGANLGMWRLVGARKGCQGSAQVLAESCASPQTEGR